MRASLRSTGQIALVLLALVVDLELWGFDTRLRFGLGDVRVWEVVASALPVFGALLLRRRRPRTVFALAWAYSVVWVVLLPTYQPFTALLLALYTVARHLPTRPAVLALLSTLPVWALATANTSSVETRTFVDLAVTAGVWCVMAGGTWLSGRYGRRAEVDARRREAAYRAEAQLALQHERLRLAREVHDVVSHSVSAMTLQAAGLRRAVRSMDPQVQTSLEAIETTGTQAAQELRRLLGLLEGPGDDSPYASLLDLDPLVETLGRCGITMSVRSSGTPEVLDHAVEHAAYRVLQEACTNAIKHGGSGGRLEASLRWEEHRLEVKVVSTAGPAAATPTLPSSGLGLAGLEARVHAVGGRFRAGPVGPGKFLVEADLPAGRG